jgi:tetratricopeptide (TPR) repeat protein
MAAGLFAVTMGVWVPQVKAAFDPRRSIAETLSPTINARGVDEAVKQYYAFKANAPTTYDFDEDQLNSLGYQLIAVKNFKDAIRILQLNVEAYPKSSNVYDSLGEAYMDAGESALAIANYRKSLELNPRNAHGAMMLKKLQTP